MATTVGILVAFDPASDPGVTLQQLAEVLSFVVIVDNALEDHPRLPADVSLPRNVRLVRNGNRGGLAGAYNLALELIFESRPEARHVVFVDEDSDVAVLSTFVAHERTREATGDDSVAAVAPAHRDRRSGLRARHVRLRRLSIQRLPRDVRGAVDVGFIINSMSLWRLDAVRRIGRYDEAFAIDQVDIDYCLRARSLGYRICLNGDCEFEHGIGRRQVYRLFGRPLQSGGHSAARRFLIGRNSIWIAKRHVKRYPVMVAIGLIRVIYEGLGIGMAESDKLSKLTQLAKGVLVGIVTRCRPAGAWSTGRLR